MIRSTGWSSSVTSRVRRNTVTRIEAEIPEGGPMAASRRSEPRSVPRIPDGSVFLGVDFSGGKNPSRKIWVAEATVEGGVLEIGNVENGFSYQGLVEKIIGREPRLALIDFPFGLAEATRANLGVDSPRIQETWETVAAYDNPLEFRDSGKGGAVGAGSEVAHKREVDREAHTPLAPLNLRLCYQTYYGMKEVLRTLGRRPEVSILPWGRESPILVGEGCPASALRHRGLPGTGYKGLGDQKRSTRESMLNGLGVRVSGELRRRVLEDREGDALDAVVLASSAVASFPPDLDPSSPEGGIYCK